MKDFWYKYTVKNSTQKITKLTKKNPICTKYVSSDILKKSSIQLPLKYKFYLDILATYF